MSVYFITGKLGSGKTLCAVGRIREYLEQGRPVATNLDLNLTDMFGERSKNVYTRVPDKPRLQDMQMLGYAFEGRDESRNGLIVLDELGTWFNSRKWNDKERGPIIDWFLHARKYNWDIFFIVQSIDVIDGQLRSSLAEHLVVCKRTDRLGIPGVGWLLSFIGFSAKLPKVHVAKVYYGDTPSSNKVATWIYRGKDLYGAYDTGQVFSDDKEYIGNELVDMRASYTVLMPYIQNRIDYREKLREKLAVLDKAQDLGAHAQRAGSSPAFFSRYALIIIPLIAVSCIAWWISSLGFGENSVIAKYWRTSDNQQIKVMEKQFNVEGLIVGRPTEQIENDYFQNITKLAKHVIVRAMYTTDKKLNGILEIESENGITKIMLSDLRSLGWIVAQSGKFLVLIKGKDRRRYYFGFSHQLNREEPEFDQVEQEDLSA